MIIEDKRVFLMRMKYLILVFICVFFSQLSEAQMHKIPYSGSQVIMRTGETKQVFRKNLVSQMEQVNGKANVAVTIANQYLLEITEISEKYVLNESKRMAVQAKIFMLDNLNNSRFESTKDNPTKVYITSLANGKVLVEWDGELVFNSVKKQISARIITKRGSATNIQTN